MDEVNDTRAEAPAQAISPKEVALLLGVSRTFVYDQIRAGRLPHVRIGARRLLIEVAELEKYLRLIRLDAGAAAGQRGRDRVPT